ncbi:Biofilm regulator 1 [Vanrija pseudolonga]|uniref:Biofilm regulator 1 n=1 Tax=Vanrija pseudolonga TaxID=143232 RepID=A0AAF1BIK1_9TREE|nr:Biofilm regulator 1 [Vanrija pseudolonga]
MSAAGVPPLGGVRCYWALLAPTYSNDPAGNPKLELKFVYMDPVLGAHLAAQKMSMLQRGVIEFIHPGEREQARNDLASAINSDDLQGSVTRMRFARLSHIRTILGATAGENAVPPDLAAVSEDDEWLILDLVLNWVADGLLLAFFHAIKDMDPAANNNPHRRHLGWSNFCGTDVMPEQQIQSLQGSIASNITPPPRTRQPPSRVFQLHSSPSHPTHPNRLLFTWPPSRPQNSQAQFDGLYDADEYADLMRGVDMDPNQLAAKPGEVRTNCTTRFGAEHEIRTEGLQRFVSSVFIPYGSVVFACFQTTKSIPLGVGASPAGEQQQWGSPTPQPQAQVPSQHTPEWRQSGEYDHGYNAAPAPAPQQPQQPQQQQQAPQVSYQADAYPQHQQYAPGPQHGGYAHDSSFHNPHMAPQADNTPPPSRTSGSTRPLVRPPGDVDKCRGCGTRESPEWRKGENGVKDLCNACGLKLARAVAKREGRQKPRKKDKL